MENAFSRYLKRRRIAQRFYLGLFLAFTTVLIVNVVDGGVGFLKSIGLFAVLTLVVVFY